MQTKRTRCYGAFLGVALVALFGSGCGDAGLGIVESGATGRVRVELTGPLSQLGAYRYYEGVRLLECDVQVEARAEGGSSGSTAEWLDGRIDLYDLRSGRYLASEYLYPGDMSFLWGSREIESGDRQRTRALRYSSYGPFRAYFLFRYEAQGRIEDTEHATDCR